MKWGNFDQTLGKILEEEEAEVALEDKQVCQTDGSMAGEKRGG
jgi:hypothetical protein